MAIRLEAIATWVEAIATRVEAITTRLEAIATGLEAIATRVEAIATRVEAIATRVEAIAIRLEAIATRVEAIAIRLEAIATRVEAIATRVEAIPIRLEAIAIRLEAIRIGLEASNDQSFLGNRFGPTNTCKIKRRLPERSTSILFLVGDVRVDAWHPRNIATNSFLLLVAMHLVLVARSYWDDASLQQTCRSLQTRWSCHRLHRCTRAAAEAASRAALLLFTVFPKNRRIHGVFPFVTHPCSLG